MNRRLQHGILTDDGVLTASGRFSSRFQVEKIKTVSDVADIAKTLNLSQVWIMNGTTVFNRLCENHETFFAENQKWNFAPKQIKHVVTVWNFGVKMQIIFAGNYVCDDKKFLPYRNLQTDFSLYQITDDKRLFDAVAWLYARLNVMPSSPQRTGKRLAEISANETLEALNENTDIYHENKAEDLICWHPEKLIGKKYIHGFDKNKAYLVAASSVSFGLGDSLAQSGGEFNKNYSGLWKVKIDKKHIRSGAEKFVEWTNGKKYLWTQDVELLIELGCKIRVVEANIWKCNKRIFEKFYKILASAIFEAKLYKMSYEASALKDIYTKFFGWLSRRQKQTFSNEFYRPDWYFEIIAATRANIIRNIFTITESNPDVEIVGVFRDTLILATNEPDIVKLPYPVGNLENRNSPYKHLYSFEQSEIADIFSTNSASVIDSNLKAIWKEKQIENSLNRIAKMPKLSEVGA